MMRSKFLRRLLCVGIVLSLWFSTLSTRASIQHNNPETSKRLISLCKLWGKVKYFYPALAYRNDIDWDVALIAAVPKVRAAQTTEEYASAVEDLLKVFGDPLAKVISTQPTASEIANTTAKSFSYRVTEDGVIIITVGDYSAINDPANNTKFTALEREITKARAVIFDLRSSTPIDYFSGAATTLALNRFERLVSPVPLTSPGERKRVHYGFESQLGGSSLYNSGFYVRDGRTFRPLPNAKDVRAVFLVNKNGRLTDFAGAFQAAGKGLIVYEGDARDVVQSPATELVDLGENLSAQVPVSEFVYADGTSGVVQPDAVVPVSSESAEKSLETALVLARSNESSKIGPKKLISIGSPLRDRSYGDMKFPALEYRLLAMFRIWNVINYFFPYKHLMDKSWDDVLNEYIPKFLDARDSKEYAIAVAEMLTNVHDSHVVAYGPAIYEAFGDTFTPIKVMVVEGEPVITGFIDEVAAKAAGARIGDVIVKVDGEEASKVLSRSEHYVTASTPQRRLYDACTRFLLGPDNTTATLLVRDKEGQTREVKLPRRQSFFRRTPERSGDIMRLLLGNIGYADLDRLTMSMVNEMFERFKDTKAIIFDMRGYPNGTFQSIARRLTEKAAAAALFERPTVGQDSFPGMNAVQAFYQKIPPPEPGKFVYKGKTVMLIDERSISQAEHMGLFLRAANGTTFIGSATAGANGDITGFSIPGGIAITFTGQSVKWPDGKQLQRVGLVPDITVKPTIAGMGQGRDEVLDRAIKFIIHQE
jgi:C-terminal processing protease CtpA/Prc